MKSVDRDRYREAMGKEPSRLPEDDPLAWQWDARLTRREIRDRLGEEATPDENEPPVVIDGQESLL